MKHDRAYLIRRVRSALGLTLGVSLVLVGSIASTAQATDIGFDPSHFRVAYTVTGGPVPGEPIYKVEAPEAAGKNSPVRMQLQLQAFSDSTFTTPVDDTDSSNNVLSFWVMRANTGNCAGE